MSYQVLALKYRPQTFESVIGQQHVTATLTNAIEADRVAHALLFTGPRGTGKTTIARILAKAMNCESGPAPQPCNQCKTCKDITSGSCSDVFEIDGASNNNVDQVRDLRANVTYMPSSARFKIYIIDEVHMLSTAAFNALLKTLEEPPEHVLFIFATTEAHKIPATILSRCQRHDLKRVAFENVCQHLETLCKEEGYTLDAKSIELIALQADGSIRDSLSLLDQILSGSETQQIKHEDVLSGLGVMDRKHLLDLSVALFSKDGSRCIELIQDISRHGIDFKVFYGELIEHFRNISILKICTKDTRTVNLAESEKEQIRKITQDLSPGYLTAILQMLLESEPMVRQASHTRTAVEAVVLRLLGINPSEQLDQILKQLDQLAGQLKDPSAGTMTKAAPTHDQPAPEVPPANVTAPSDALPENSPAKEQQVSAGHSWPDFLNQLENRLPFIYALIKEAAPQFTDPDRVVIVLESCSPFNFSRIESKKEQVSQMCRKLLGKPLAIKIKTTDSCLPDDKEQQKTKARHAALNHPVVQKAQEIFNGRIINV